MNAFIAPRGQKGVGDFRFIVVSPHRRTSDRWMMKCTWLMGDCFNQISIFKILLSFLSGSLKRGNDALRRFKNVFLLFLANAARDAVANNEPQGNPKVSMAAALKLQ